MRVSVKLHNASKHPVIWNEYLQHPDLRIWGATRWNFVHVPKEGYAYQPDGEGADDPLKQLQVYFELTKTFGSASEGSFNNYIARLMPGGPTRYKTALNNDVEDANTLTIADMPHSSFMHGTDKSQNSFIAIKIIDLAQNDDEPTLLLFISSKGKWSQKGNKYWNEDALKLSKDQTKGYLLGILKREDLSNRHEWVSPEYKKTISLV